MWLILNKIAVAGSDRELVIAALWSLFAKTTKRLLCQILILSTLVASVSFYTANAETGHRPAKLAYGFSYAKTDEGWKITIKFDGKPDSQIFLMDTPGRLVLEISGGVFNLKDSLPDEADELITEMRSGAVTSDRSRLVITLAQPIEIKEKNLVQIEDSKRFYLELLLRPTSVSAFRKAIDEQQALMGSSGEAVVKGDRVRAGPRKAGTFAIVIDPGHGGIDGGSVGKKTGVLEKELTLKIAQLIGKKIEALGPFEVSYTRTDDVFVSLKKRQKFAQRQNADLMISIHADSLRQLFVRGATIYTLAKKATDALSQSIADSENLADVVAGLAAPEAQNDVTDILADLTLRETTRFSHTFSSLLVDRLKNAIKLIKNPQRAASFAVLKNAETPSVLIELGYLSNEEDEKLLLSDEWQEKTTSLIAKAVKDFFATKQPHNSQN